MSLRPKPRLTSNVPEEIILRKVSEDTTPLMPLSEMRIHGAGNGM
jgi:hypothetical protein